MKLFRVTTLSSAANNGYAVGGCRRRKYRRCPWRLRYFDAHRIMASSRIREHAATGTAVEGIAPERLHRERAGGERDVRRGTLPRRDPGALVAVLRAGGVQPTGARALIGDRLAHFMTANDGDASVRAGSVDGGATARACVSDVRQIGVGDVAVRVTGGAGIGAI